MLKNITKQCINALFPHVCLLCYGKTRRDLSLCKDCEGDLPWIRHPCHQCGLPLAAKNLPHPLCARCQQQKPHYDHVVALFSYSHPINHFISRLKFHSQLLYASCLGQLMATRLEEYYQAPQSKPECIIPMPLHNKRLGQRGFNQAIELARPIQKTLKIPVKPYDCQRIRATQAQSLLSSVKARADNVKNAFKANLGEYKHILIIDDVITTAHTMNELSRACRQQGVERIDVACCARTISSG